MNTNSKPKTGSRAKIQYRTSKGTYTSKLTRKQKAWADTYIVDKKAPLTDIARQTYNVTDSKVAHDISRQNLENPRIQVYLEQHVDKAREKIVSLISSDKEEIALRASQDVIDRTHGKATQRTEVQSSKLSIHIDLTGTIDTE